MAKIKKVTVREIAEIAGVSMMTVSRVVNGVPGASAETRKKIQKIIEELDYHPSSVAQRLKGKTSKTLCILVSQYVLKQTMSNVNFHSEMWRLLVAEGCLNGYRMSLTTIDPSGNTKPDYIKIAEERSVTGFITMELDQFDTRLDKFFKLEIPVVSIGIQGNSSLPFYSISTDDYAAGVLATEYLIQQGYRKIGFLGFPQYGIGSSKYRLRAFQETLQRQNIPLEEGLICFTERLNEEISGYEGMKQLLSNDVQPDAVFCTSDLRALGAIRAIQEAGLKVKEDVAVMGFDDLLFAQGGTTPLTTIRQPFESLTHEAIQIFSLLEQQKQPPQKHLLFPGQLIQRMSA